MCGVCNGGGLYTLYTIQYLLSFHHGAAARIHWHWNDAELDEVTSSTKTFRQVLLINLMRD